MRIPAYEFPDGFAEWLQPLFDGRQRFVAGLDTCARWVAGTVVESFVRDGRGPTRAELHAGSAFSAPEVDAALEHLNSHDMLMLAGECVVALYPFSDRACPHRVRVAAKRLYGM